MSIHASPSESLRTLQRHNYSKSTVSSSDTDVDSTGYASSSGTTTPEDDTQTFHLGHTLQGVLAEKPKCATSREKPTIVTRNRNFSSAVKRIKKVAHALVMFKRKRPDDISPILISSPLRERFGKRMSVKSHPEEGFYSLPNRRFSLSDASTQLGQSQTVARKFGTISGSTCGFAKGATFGKQRNELRTPAKFSDTRYSPFPPPPSVTAVAQQTRHEDPTFGTILLQILRVLLFVPWCAAVGGFLLLFPDHAGPIAFHTGYYPHLQGIRRFAYWAECGQQHVMIFLACLVVIVWYNHALGLSLMSIVASRFVFLWHGFKVDKSIPLGEDDQQSLYLVIMGLTSVDGSFTVSLGASSIAGESEMQTDDLAEVAETEAIKL